MRETGEEAVVSKTARVTGEVEVGKTATEREETIRDTVRQTKVEVEKIAADVEPQRQPRKLIRRDPRDVAHGDVSFQAHQFFRQGADMSIVAWLVVGLIAGFIASKIVNKSGEGVVLDIVLGVIGALVGGFLFNLMGAGGVDGINLYSILVAVVGAVVVLVLYHAIRRAWARTGSAVAAEARRVDGGPLVALRDECRSATIGCPPTAHRGTACAMRVHSASLPSSRNRHTRCGIEEASMKHTLSRLPIVLLAAAIGPLAAAQTTPASTDHPTPIGTSQQTADQANRKAVQEGGTATVVRTGPSAADRLRGASSSARDKATRAKASVKSKTKAATADGDTAADTTTTVKP